MSSDESPINGASSGSVEEFEDSTPAVNSIALARSLGYEYREQLKTIDPPRILKRGDFSRLLGSWGKQFKMIPIGEDELNVYVAVSDPLNTPAIDALRLCYGKHVKIVVVPESEIIRAINSVRTTIS